MIQIQKVEVKLLLFADDMSLYCKDSNKIILKSVKHFNNKTDCKNQHRKLKTLLCITNFLNQEESGRRKKIPLAWKNITPRNEHDNENCRILTNTIEDGKASYDHGWAELIS